MTATATSIKLEDSLKERIKRLADDVDRTPHWVMREAIVQYVDREEARNQMWLEANEALAEYDATGLHLTQEEMEAWAAKRAKGEDADLPECHT